MSEPVKYRGIAFEFPDFGDGIVIVPPLTTVQLEGFADNLDANAALAGKTLTIKECLAHIKINVLPVVTSALQRNYPDITESQVMAGTTTENWGQLIAAVLGNSSLPKVRKGEPFPVSAS